MSKSTVWITTQAKVQTLRGLMVFLFLFLLSCKSNLPYSQDVVYGTGIRDSLPVKYLRADAPSNKLLLYLTRKPDSLNWWKSDFFKTLHLKGDFDIIYPGLTSAYDFFLQESMDVKSGRTEDLIGLLNPLQKQESLAPNTKLYLLADNMEAEVAVNIASHFTFEKVILIDLSAISRMHDIASLLSKELREDSLTAKFLMQYRIDTTLTKSQLISKLKNKPPHEYTVGNKRNSYWMSYLNDPVLTNIKYARGNIHFVYTPLSILDLQSGIGLLKNYQSNNKAASWHFHQVSPPKKEDEKPLEQLLQQLLLPGVRQ